MRNKGDLLQLQSYKHNKEIHRIWEKATFLHEDDEKIVVVNNKTKVVESNGRFWSTREPAVCIFYKEKWYNVIGMLKNDGIYYYCNLASPALLDEEALKYIDYDLDVRIEPSFRFKILDRNEFNKHKVKMKYPKRVKNIIENELIELIDDIKEKRGPFNHAYIMKWYEEYKRMDLNER